MSRTSALVLKVTAMLLALIAGVWVAVAFVFGSEVQSRYETLLDAKKDLLFERGWLPDILPPSAERLLTRNDLDLNTSSGEFYFKPGDWAAFKSRLTPVETKDNTSSSVSAWRFSENSSTWVFFCNPAEGYCKYVLSPDRHV